MCGECSDALQSSPADACADWEVFRVIMWDTTRSPTNPHLLQSDPACHLCSVWLLYTETTREFQWIPVHLHLCHHHSLHVACFSAHILNNLLCLQSGVIACFIADLKWLHHPALSLHAKTLCGLFCRWEQIEVHLIFQCCWHNINRGKSMKNIFQYLSHSHNPGTHWIMGSFIQMRITSKLQAYVNPTRHLRCVTGPSTWIWSLSTNLNFP